jgi:hypothetical protein
MIFFMVMPALIGGFGKINKNTIKRDFSTEKQSNEESELRSKLGPYLAGPPSTRKNLSLVVWGSNLLSTVGEGKLTKSQREMIKLPLYHYSVVVGIMLSDGNLSLSTSKSKNARFRLKQSYSHREYV